MNKYDDTIKLDIFKPQSTYQNDYKKLPVESHIPASLCKKTLYDLDGHKRKPKRDYIFQDNETFTHWRPDVHIPFNLLWRRKEIIHTNPYEPFTTPVSLPQYFDLS